MTYIQQRNIIISYITIISLIISLLISPILPSNYIFAQESENNKLIQPSIILNKTVGQLFKGDNVTIIAQSTNNGKYAKAKLYFRPRGSEKYHSIAMINMGGGDYFAKIPFSETDTSYIEYYIEFIDEIFTVYTKIQLIHLSENPSSDKISALKMTTSNIGPKPWYMKWWFWTIVGTVALGVAAKGEGGGDSGNSKPITINISAESP